MDKCKHGLRKDECALCLGKKQSVNEKLNKESTKKQKLSSLTSSRIRNVLSGNKKIRLKSSVGYNESELKEHLSKTMPKGCTWQDYYDGNLHVDHIIPVSAHDYDNLEDKDFKACWALRNLRLLPGEENLKKGSRITTPFQLCGSLFL